ncbi:DUF309 domain-containing protein [Paenibacillus thermotolerans]|uniref:DUF309 domain-containing protein n=1 Tax=Paenibacillus thermotolerans TaxID=3027807 RepID=UPI00236858DB|nr:MULTISPECIES: DUF309 domain-containing protein [unclassified Paenibacillus]
MTNAAATQETYYDPLYVAFLYYFNVERDYFECHEVMEALWLEEGRDPLYQGLLQVAVGLYHHRGGNIDGGVKLLTAAIAKLEEREPELLGIRLDRLVQDARRHLANLKRHDTVPFPFRDLDIEIADPSLSKQVAAFVPPESDEGH